MHVVRIFKLSTVVLFSLTVMRTELKQVRLICNRQGLPTKLPNGHTVDDSMPSYQFTMNASAMHCAVNVK